MKVFITGATGFIGKRLVRRLIQEQFEIVCTGRSLHRLACFPKSVEMIYLEIEDKKCVMEILQKQQPDVVFHCAAETKSKSFDRLRKINREGTKNILDACLHAGISKVIYLSSTSVLAGNIAVLLTDNLPYAATNRYGQSKLEAEKIAKEYRRKGLNIAILRPVMVYGEEDSSAIALLLDLIRWGLFPIIGNGENRFPLVYVENVVDVMILSIMKEAAYKGTYIIADEESVTLNELYGYIAQLWGVRQPFHLPSFFVPLFEHLPFVGERFRIFLKDRICSIQQLYENLEYIPKVSFHEGMQKVVSAHKRRMNQ